MRSAIALATVVLGNGLSGVAHCHCQIPCGIYDDALRIKAMLEDVATVQKAIGEIEKLAATKSRSAQEENQLARWIMNKERHAGNIQETVSQYFLAQRIKPVSSGAGKAYADYTRKLAALHAVTVKAMQVKQAVDGDKAAQLGGAVMEFARLYLPEEDYLAIEKAVH